MLFRRHGVLHALGTPADATVAAPRGDAETASEVESGEDLHELHAGQHGPGGVVRVHQGWQPEDQQEEPYKKPRFDAVLMPFSRRFIP